ncbi:MAG TPA: hypothetical protein VHA52_07415, partial [Candidatus Babeliaceae bacterium]|nr:hypothetical protein [Candidatus Babeliaceae bacterium]
ESIDDKRRLQGIGDGITKQKAAVPVNEGNLVHKASFHGDIGYVSTPNLVGAVNDDGIQQIGVDIVLSIREAEIGFLIDCRDTHEFVKSPHSFYIDVMPCSSEIRMHTGHTDKGPFEVDLIYFTHQSKI